MELLRGESLREHLNRRKPMPIDDCLEVGVQMLRALAAAHEVGVGHRDVKSDNIFLARDVRQGGLLVKVLDFGISTFGRAAGEGAHVEHPSAVQGTPHYMAPEKAEGRGDLDNRVDICAAGAVLYEMIAGVVPHRNSNPSALLSMMREKKIAPPSLNRRDVPEGLDSLVMKALARDRELRPKSCEEFVGPLRPSEPR